jgi:WD40 repeat protein
VQFLFPQQLGKPTISQSHSGQVRSVNFSPNGQLILTGSTDKTLKLWDVRSRRLLRTMSGHTKGVNCVAFSTTESDLAASGGDDGLIRIWNLIDGTEIRLLQGHNHTVNSLAFSPDGSLIVSGGGGIFGDKTPEYADKKVRLWDVSTGQLLKTFEGHTSSVTCVKFSPDGNHMFSAGGDWDNSIRMWNINTGKLVRLFSGHRNRIESIDISPNGNLLVAGDFMDAVFIIWDVNQGKIIRKIEGNSMGPSTSNFSHDGRYLILGQFNGIFTNLNTTDYELYQVYGANTVVGGAKSGSIQDPNSSVLATAFSPKSDLIVSGHSDSKIKLWNRSTGKLAGTFPEKSISARHTAEGGNLNKNNYKKIFDQSTGLEWCIGPNKDMNWFHARDWIKSISSSGNSWRMPTRQELRDIYRRYDRNTFIDLDEASFVWSGDYLGKVEGYEQAYRFNFYNADIGYFACIQSWNYRALAVRKR